MGFEGADFDAIEGVSPGFLDKMLERWMNDRSSVDPGWASWFEGLERSAAGPSWRKPNWPPADADPLAAAMDPTQAVPVEGTFSGDQGSFIGLDVEVTVSSGTG